MRTSATRHTSNEVYRGGIRVLVIKFVAEKLVLHFHNLDSPARLHKRYCNIFPSEGKTLAEKLGPQRTHQQYSRK